MFFDQFPNNDRKKALTWQVVEKTPVICEMFGEVHMTHCVVLDETCTLAEAGAQCHAEFTGETRRIFYLD